MDDMRWEIALPEGRHEILEFYADVPRGVPNSQVLGSVYLVRIERQWYPAWVSWTTDGSLPALLRHEFWNRQQQSPALRETLAEARAIAELKNRIGP